WRVMTRCRAGRGWAKIRASCGRKRSRSGRRRSSRLTFSGVFFFFSSRRRHTRSVSAFLLNRSSDLDVRDEFVSVTEKLMDELAQCYNVLPQLDINNTIDHRPEGDEKWFLENEKTVTQFCRKLA